MLATLERALAQSLLYATDMRCIAMHGTDNIAVERPLERPVPSGARPHIEPKLDQSDLPAPMRAAPVLPPQPLSIAASLGIPSAAGEAEAALIR